MSRVPFYGIPWLRSANPTGQATQREGLRLRYKSWCNKPKTWLGEKHVAYPEIDLTVIFVQLYLEGHQVGIVLPTSSEDV